MTELENTPLVTAPHSKRKRGRWVAVILAVAAAGLGLWYGIAALLPENDISAPDWVQKELIEVDGAARRGTPLETVTAIAVHYVGNPNTTAMQNRNYFNQKGVSVSAHFIVGLEGEIIQCVPLNEISSATNYRNRDTISIEVCHPDATGKFNKKTYASLVKLVTWLCGEFHLDETDLLRHYDVTGKLCPLYYVQNPQAWAEFVKEIGRNLTEKSE